MPLSFQTVIKRINSPLKLTLDLIAKSSTYQNAVNPPALRFINKAKTNHQPIWTADFVRQMTSFQKTSSVINIHQGAYESSLAALGYGTDRSSAMF